MRTSKTLAVAGSAVALAAAAAIPATAGTTHPAAAHHPTAAHHPATGKHGTLKGKISPSHGIKNGTKITLKVKKGAEKKTNYLCLFAIIKGKNQNGPNLSNETTVKSNKKGAFHCTLTFHKFSAQVGSKMVKCPPTKKESKQGYICGFAGADPLNSQGSNTFQYMHFK